MTRFGFSAYLRIINLKSNKQKSELKQRFKKDKNPGGYDFHAEMRRIIRGLALGEISLSEAEARTKMIKKLPERKYAKRALEAFIHWRTHQTGEFFAPENCIYEHKSGLFKILYDPNFALKNNGRVVYIHIWNTEHPLDRRLTVASLDLMQNEYQKTKLPTPEIAVLSLSNGQFYISSGSPENTLLGQRIADSIGQIITSILPSPKEPEPPSAPAPEGPTPLH